MPRLWQIVPPLFIQLLVCLPSLSAAPPTEPLVSIETVDVQPAFDGLPFGSPPLADALMPSETRAPTVALSTVAEASDGISRERLAELMRPTFGLEGEWQSATNEIQLSSYGASIQVPTYPVFGPPPPLIRAGYVFTEIDRPAEVDLPDALHDYSLGFTWIRPVNDRWLLRFMASAALATDGNNQSSDAWRFRGGAFAMYRPEPDLTWILGVIALGRNDLPAVPAVGLVWQPRDDLRFDITLPKPRIAQLISMTADRQQWCYVGVGLNGGTWGYERADGTDDQVTYGDWRWIVGWESTPTLERGMPFARGRKMTLEAGYVFSREFEFERAETSLRLDDTWMLRGAISF